ncbi:MAG: NAD(P)/FAD-dependent oxidoreductase [Myxococcota bacterium]
MRRVDIIGAGISGLATAFYLSKSKDKYDIHVWERDEFPGGLAGVFSKNDIKIEKFYHHIYKKDIALQALISEIGLGDELIWRPARVGTYYFNKPYKLSSPLDLLSFSPLPFTDRIRLGMMVLKARRIKDWESLDDITTKEFVERMAGGEVYRTVWEPLLKGKFGEYGNSISAAWLWSKLVDRGGSRNASGREILGYIKGSYFRLFQKLIDIIEGEGHHIHLGSPIKKLEIANGRVEKIVASEGSFKPDIVISCAQTPDLVRLISGETSGYKESLERIRFLSNVCLVLTLKQSLSEFYWTNITDTRAPFVGIIEQTRWLDAQDYSDKHIVYISTYVTAEDKRNRMNEEEIFNIYFPYIKENFPHFKKDVVEDLSVWKAEYAQPIVSVGYRKLIPQIVSPINNLFVCTMAQIYPQDRQVSNGVSLAKQTAELILSKTKE